MAAAATSIATKTLQNEIENKKNQTDSTASAVPNVPNIQTDSAASAVPTTNKPNIQTDSITSAQPNKPNIQTDSIASAQPNKPNIQTDSIASAQPNKSSIQTDAASADPAQSAGRIKMSELLPLHECYLSRKQCVKAVKLAVIQATGKGVKVDDARSGSKKVVLRCSSVMKKVRHSSAKWVGDLMDDFTCEKRDAESIWSYKRRRAKELESFANRKHKVCSFKAEARKKNKKGEDRKHCWEFILQENGFNYIEHSPNCEATAKITGDILRSLIRSAVAADPRQKNSTLMSTLKNLGITEAMLPSKSSTYRAQKAVRIEVDAWYDEDDAYTRRSRGRPKIKRARVPIIGEPIKRIRVVDAGPIRDKAGAGSANDMAEAAARTSDMVVAKATLPRVDGDSVSRESHKVFAVCI